MLTGLTVEHENLKNTSLVWRNNVKIKEGNVQAYSVGHRLREKKYL
jgi:hypothetical protein